MSGSAIRGLAAFFCSLWDFTLYLGVATTALGLATGVIIVRSPINALFCLIGVFISYHSTPFKHSSGISIHDLADSLYRGYCHSIPIRHHAP